MLGTTHADVVKLFQSVPIGQSVTLVLCRGYPLPFDPEDPSGAASTSLTPIGLEHRPLVVNGRGSYDPYLEYLSLSSQLPPQALAQPGAPHPGDTHLDGSSLPSTTPGSAPALTPHDDNVSMASSGTAGVAGAAAQGAELLTVTMVKGSEGFGFTIADSPTGQRVKQVIYDVSSVHTHMYFLAVFPNTVASGSRFVLIIKSWSTINIELGRISIVWGIRPLPVATLEFPNALAAIFEEPIE